MKTENLQQEIVEHAGTTQDSDYVFGTLLKARIHSETLEHLVVVFMTAAILFWRMMKLEIVRETWIALAGIAVLIIGNISWAVAWWRYISPTLDARMHMRKAKDWSIFFILDGILSLVYAWMALTQSCATMFHLIGFLLFLDYSRMGFNFFTLWSTYKRSNFCKDMSFIEFCNCSQKNLHEE